jgi:hypothetical protein
MLIGLVQGSVIGPPFFTYFINDLAEVIKIAVPEMYVDDTNLIYFDVLENRDKLVTNIENELHCVNEWVDNNSLALNSLKTKLMLVGTKTRLACFGNLSIMFNGTIIQECETLKCLGLVIDSTLSWEAHITSMARACHTRISSLYKIKDFLSEENKIMIGQALIMSLLNYMSSIWSGAVSKNLKIAEKVIRCLARFVSCKRKYESIAPTICNDLKWLFPQELSHYNILCIYYKLYKCEPVPIPFFSDLFKLRSAVHRYPTSSSTNMFCEFVPRTNYGYATFYYRSTLYWNDLPNYIKESPSIAVFKNKLKTYLVNLQKIRLNIQ